VICWQINALQARESAANDLERKEERRPDGGLSETRRARPASRASSVELVHQLFRPNALLIWVLVKPRGWQSPVWEFVDT